MRYEDALRIVRVLIDHGIQQDDAINNSAIPDEYRSRIVDDLKKEKEEFIILEPPRTILAEQGRETWLQGDDRQNWYYWPQLRQYLLVCKGRTLAEIRLLDEVTDRILGQLASPYSESFNIRGLVLGYVQSGKTENYTALIAKAADTGYRLFIILSGTDNGLRLQTQKRLKRELVGYPNRRYDSVPLPPLGRQWHEFTREDINGDFRPGYANHAALQGSQPVLLVIKKNGNVLRRLLSWLNEAPDDVRQNISMLIIDDEADLASIDTRGTYQTQEDIRPDEIEDPSVINKLIRQLLTIFKKSAYVAYTATPFANILIPHDTFNPIYSNDLYPKDFIIDLPKRPGYFGAEELFGIYDAHDDNVVEGLDIIREVPEGDIDLLDDSKADDIPASIETALIDFVLAGSAYAQRVGMEKPATMLIHVSRYIEDQRRLSKLVENKFIELRDEWRYYRKHGIRERLSTRWNDEFRPLIQTVNPSQDVTFNTLEGTINEFFESIRIRVINSETGEVLDYYKEPSIKAIAIGGDRLSRGLTFEGLLVSYFIRRTPMYDTLMQMGRWFGYREKYSDITRIYTTRELADWYAALAYAEHQLRLDLQIYEDQGLTPYDVGMRIWQHPSMQVTSPLKRRFARQIKISQSYSGQRAQTFRFPFNEPETLARQEDNNLGALKKFVLRLGAPIWINSTPIWTGIPVNILIEFLSQFQAIESGMFSINLIKKYIERQNVQNELIRWTVAICGLNSFNEKLGQLDLGLEQPIWQISRTKKKHCDSLGVITSPGDEVIGLSESEKERMKDLLEGLAQKSLFQGKRKLSEDVAARRARSPENGLLLIYPISKWSGHERELSESGNREPIYRDPEDPFARDIIGIAISFPVSDKAQFVEAYLTGTANWRPVDDTDIEPDMD